MATPYDGKILLVNWKGRTTPGDTVADTAALIHARMPNVAGVMLKTSNGVFWQAHFSDDDPKAITGVARIQEWVEALQQQGLEVHVWGVPRASLPEGTDDPPDLQAEAAKFISAANVPGVRSLLLDVEHGDLYWQGTPDQVGELMTLVREGIGNDTHIGMILDGRHNRPFHIWVDPWMPFVDSLHPMVYPVLFGGYQAIGDHLDESFENLSPYGRPIVPMLQAFGEHVRRPTPEEITLQGNAAWARGAAGISFFRLGSDIWQTDMLPHMGDPEYAAIAAIPIPDGGGEPIATDYTWQDVINASVTVACRTDGSWEQWLSEAGVMGLLSDSVRELPYSGPPVEGWPLEPGLLQQILELLELDSAELARVTAEAQAEKEGDRELGSIIGIHGAPGIAAPPVDTWETWINYLKEMGIKWYKQCDNGDPNDLGPHTVFAWAKRLKQEGIEPIIRYLVSQQFPDQLPDRCFQKMEHYAAEGIVWAEIGNEPNLDLEWKSDWHNPQDGPPKMHFNSPEVIRSIAETWVTDAQKTISAGAKPAFYAFAPTDWGDGGFHPVCSSVFFTRKVTSYLAEHLRNETIGIFQRGGWIAVHAATYEKPVDFDPFIPGRPVWDMTLRSYEVVLRAFRDSFGTDLDVGSIVVISTEGGVFTPKSKSYGDHPAVSDDAEHAQRVVEMFKWLELHSPLQAMCPWCISVGGLIGHFDSRFEHDGWIEEVNGELRPRPVVEALRRLRLEREGG